MKTLEIVQFKNEVFLEIVRRAKALEVHGKVSAFEIQTLSTLCMIHRAAADALVPVPDSLDVTDLVQTVERLKLFVRFTDGEEYSEAYIFAELRKMLDMPAAEGGVP